MKLNEIYQLLVEKEEQLTKERDRCALPASAAGILLPKVWNEEDEIQWLQIKALIMLTEREMSRTSLI